MYIDQLKLINYRCFEEISIDLHKSFTLLVGNNGSGKSSILDGLAVGLAGFLRGLEGGTLKNISRTDVRVSTYSIGSRLERQAQFPARIECRGRVFDRQITWARALNTDSSSNTYGELNVLTNIVKEAIDKIRKGDTTIVLPLLSYYGTGRLWAQKKEKKQGSQVNLNKRTSGYVDCLDAMSNDKLMYKWFEQMTYQELQEGSTIPELTAVKKAILDCFKSSYNNEMIKTVDKCEYNVKTSEIEITYTSPQNAKIVRSFREMSDGYRNMLSLVADIAYRMALLNPQLLEQVTKETPGIVLIDEIDLHLHPAWQRHIVECLKQIFPRVQFIASTHAPSVIASVPRDEVVILENYNVISAYSNTYGKDSNAILQILMGVPARPDDILAKFNRFYKALDSENYQHARQILSELREILGDDDPELNGATVTLQLESME